MGQPAGNEARVALRTRAAGAVLAGLLGLTLTGCGDQGAGSVQVTTSPAATDTATAPETDQTTPTETASPDDTATAARTDTATPTGTAPIDSTGTDSTGTDSTGTDSTGTASPTGSPTGTGAGSPTATAPPYPRAAQADTEAGQEAFARYWFETTNHAIATGDTEPVKAISERSAANADLWDPLEQLYDADGYVVGHQYRVISVRAEPRGVSDVTRARAAVVSVTFSQAAGVEVQANGRSTPRDPVARSTKEMKIQYVDGRWRFISLGEQG